MAQELTKDEKRAQKRKDLIKNILIGFLAVMLVLTFFSGTIQNYSLPEVATEYVQSGSVSPQIRGNGTVEADDPYNVVVHETRKIASVAVRVGDSVKKDDPIYYLEDIQSTELDDAIKALAELELQFQTQLFSGDIPNEIITRIRNGETRTLDEYQAQLADVNARYNEAVRADADMQYLIDLRGYELAYDNADNRINVSSEVYTTAEAQYELTRVGGDKEAASSSLANARSAVTAAEGALADYLTAWKLNPLIDDPSGPGPATTTDTEPAQADYPNAYQKVVQMRQNISNARVRVSDAEAAYDSLSSRERTLNELIARNTMTTAQLTEYHAAQSYQLQENYNQDIAVLNQMKLQTARTLSDVEDERKKLIDTINKELTLLNMNAQIAAAEQKVEALRENAIGATINAPVDGTITSLAYVAGQTTKPDEPAAVIQVDGKEMIVSFSVTTDQAKELKVGDIAEPQNAWFYSQFRAELTAIRPDPQDPASRKLLVFSIESPEVSAGQNVALKIGEAQRNYDLTVPNSAIREDNNGKFVLVVNARSSPFGNRYVAQRVDVQVLASDDTKSAIAAAIDSWGVYVITTSTAPIRAGQQVRLASGGY